MSHQLGQPPAAGLGYFGTSMTGAQVGGSGGVSAVRVLAYVRESTNERPYGVVNDYISSTLARLAGVPVPPGMLLELGGGKRGYLSMAFGHRGDAPPPVIFSKFAKERPWEATGVILIDQWMANPDRNDGNIAYMPDEGVVAFDFDLALLGRAEEPVEALRAYQDAEMRSHEVAPHLETGVYFAPWAQRIASVMSEEIGRVVGDCAQAQLVSKSVADQLYQFIEHRKTRLLGYIGRTRAEYTAIEQWPIDAEEVAP